MLDAADALPRLAATYRRGMLVPFLGAGMSHPSCVLWSGFVERLEKEARTQGDGASSTDLTARAQKALLAIRRRNEGDLVEAIRRSLRNADAGPVETTPQIAALTQLRWPLVLTTNYDDLYVVAAGERYEGEENEWDPSRADQGPRVVGRSPVDCRQVLAALHEPSDRLLWALHGWLGGLMDERSDRLPAAELVVGHEEYRRVVHQEPHFRRAFAEVLRSRSLFFLGCGLDDPHLVGLFEETSALTGPGPMPHFALVSKADMASAKRWQLEQRLAITPIQIEGYADVPRFLTQLSARVNAPEPRIGSWPIWLNSPRDGREGVADLEIVRGLLPTRPGPKACLAVSAGRGRPSADGRRFGLWFSGGIWAQLKELGIDPKSIPRITPGTAVALPGVPAIAGLARSANPQFGRDARVLASTTEAILNTAAANGYAVVHAQLLATGRGRAFPARSSLAQMMRGFARWRRRSSAVRLRIHVVDEELLLDLVAGRIDLLELLSPDEVRYWVEVADDDGRVDRELRYDSLDTTLAQVAEPHFAGGPGWSAAVVPGPTRAIDPVSVAEDGKLTLDELGVLPGATLRFWADGPILRRARP